MADTATKPRRPAEPGGGVPRALTHWAIGIGLVLTLMGIALVVLDKGQVVGNLTICVGFGIILAAFGTRASGEWQTWTITGAGAMAIVLFLILQQAAPPAGFVKRGQIGGDIQKLVDLRIVDESPLYSYRDSTTKSIRFVVLQKQFTNPQVNIQVESADGPFEMVGDGQAIAQRFANVEFIKWTYDHAQRVVKDQGEVIFQVTGRLDTPPVASVAPTGRVASLIGSAFAQFSGASDARSLITALSSDNQIVQRNARDDLAAIGPEAVRPMMAAWRKAPADARLKGGVVIALNTMLRQKASLNTAIVKELSDDDIKLLVAAAGDEDKTVRVQAAEFLFRLKDGRIVQHSVQAAQQSKNPDGVYNSVVILKPVFNNLDRAEQLKVQSDLLKAVPAQNTRTREMVQQLPVKAR